MGGSQRGPDLMGQRCCHLPQGRQPFQVTELILQATGYRQTVIVTSCRSAAQGLGRDSAPDGHCATDSLAIIGAQDKTGGG
jgi:hypothetical protein